VTKKRKPGSPKPYTTGEIAEELGVNPSTVINMMDRGEIDCWYWSNQAEAKGWRLVTVKDWREWRRRHTGRRGIEKS
jgi:IS30 family transposase